MRQGASKGLELDYLTEKTMLNEKKLLLHVDKTNIL